MPVDAKLTIPTEYKYSKIGKIQIAESFPKNISNILKFCIKTNCLLKKIWKKWGGAGKKHFSLDFFQLKTAVILVVMNLMHYDLCI